jgi:adenylosuccinate synthase
LAKQIVLVSGRVSSGKTTLGDNLVDKFGFIPFKTKDWIRQLACSIEQERGALQNYGDILDQRTQGSWVCDELTRNIKDLPDDALILVDAVRIIPQIDFIRKAYGYRVFHIHLYAPLEVLEKRYKKRKKEGFKELPAYSDLLQNETESKVNELAAVADVVIDTNRCTPDDIVIRAASHLGLYSREDKRLVDILVGGEYGSEGKGHIASYLSREYDILVRTGGPNAGHKVFEEPSPYTFHHLPSGTRSSEAKLLIGPGAVIGVETLLREINDCQVDVERLSIDQQAMIIEKQDVRGEMGLVKDIASTGQGVGYATARRIKGRGTQSGKNKVRLARDVRELQPFIRDTYGELEKAFSAGKKVFLEGTQGTGLSLYHGIYPHVTSRDTTVAGCLAEAGISPSRVRKVIMVCRTYPIRVGNAPESGKTSGYMSQPLSWSEISRRSDVPIRELRTKEKTSTTNRERRVGEFDWALIRKAAVLNGPTDIALTFADYINIENREARRFEQLTEETIRFVEEVERVVSAPVSLISTRFHSRSIIDRRSW